EADVVEARAVQRPQRAAAVLDADRPVANQRVEERTVELARNRLVVADPAHPTFGGGAPGRGPQHTRQVAGVVDRGRAAPDRPVGGSQGQEVDVMVVEAREQGRAPPVEHLVAAATGQTGADGHDAVTGDPDVEPWPSVDLDVLD